MIDDEFRARLMASVPRETFDRLDGYVALLRDEAARQNLVAASTLLTIWQRHILDSAQLVPLARAIAGPWIDIGSGAGLPGIVVAILRDAPCVLIEPRAKRVAFLQRVVESLSLTDRATIVPQIAASAPPTEAAVISARAVASLDALFLMGQRFASRDTLWILPKGRTAADELASAKASWQGDFRMVPSQTDSEAAIIVAQGVRPRMSKRP